MLVEVDSRFYIQLFILSFARALRKPVGGNAIALVSSLASLRDHVRF